MRQFFAFLLISYGIIIQDVSNRSDFEIIKEKLLKLFSDVIFFEELSQGLKLIDKRFTLFKESLQYFGEERFQVFGEEGFQVFGEEGLNMISEESYVLMGEEDHKIFGEDFLQLLGEESEKSFSDQSLQTQPPAKINFIGDWGDCISTTPTGPLDKQQRVADVYNSLPNDYLFTVSLGDNFYPNGTENQNDWKFQYLWENVYHDNKLWYIIAGNHDYNSNVTAPLEYAKMQPRWIFPSKYYDLYVPEADAYLIFLDTQILAATTIEIKAQTTKKIEQLLWFEEKLQVAQNSSWIIVIGHYNIYSGQSRIEQKTMQNLLLPFLKKYKVNAYICGHCHLSEFFYYEDIAYVVNGDGGRFQVEEYDTNKKPKANFYNNNNVGSFTQLEFLDKHRLNITYFMADAERSVFNYMVRNKRKQKSHK